MRAKDQSGQSGEHHRACTHCTGFECRVKRAIRQPPNTQFFCCLTENEHFGMRRGIISLNDAIVIACYHLAMAHYDRADGHFAFSRCCPSFCKGEFHAHQVIVLHANSKRVKSSSRLQARKIYGFHHRESTINFSVWRSAVSGRQSMCLCLYRRCYSLVLRNFKPIMRGMDKPLKIYGTYFDRSLREISASHNLFADLELN